MKAWVLSIDPSACSNATSAPVGIPTKAVKEKHFFRGEGFPSKMWVQQTIIRKMVKTKKGKRK